MANYSIIINSRFKPFSYAEMLAPVQQSTEAHQQLEEAYATLTTQADMIAAKASEQTDPKAYARYKKYSEELQQQAERLAKYGLQPDSRRDVFSMRSKYTKDILPIAEAAEKRQKYADMQFQAQLQNPTLLIGKRAINTSLDEFLDNPNIDFSQQYSGATLMQQVAAQAQSLAKELTSYGPGKPLDAYTNTFLKKYGFTRNDVLNAINNPNDPNSSKVLTAIVDQALISSGIPQWGDAKTLERARAYANQGLWSAVGQSDVAPMENFGARKTLEYDLADRNNARQFARQMAAARAASRGGGGHGGGSGSGDPGQPKHIGVSTNQIPIKGKVSKEDARSTFYNLMETTGIYGNNGKFGGVTTPKNPKYRDAAMGINTSLFKDQNGKKVLKTKEEFAAGGGNIKYVYENYYDDAVKQMKKVGLNPKEGITTAEDIYNAGSNYWANSGTVFINGVNTNFGADNNKSVLKTNINSLIPNKNSGAYEINSANDIAKIIETGEGENKASATDIIKYVENKDKGNGSINYQTIMADGYQGILIQSGDKNWFIPKDRLPQPAQTAFNTYSQGYNYVQEQLYSKDRNIYNTNPGLAAYDLEQLGSSTYDDIQYSVFGEYGEPKLKVIP